MKKNILVFLCFGFIFYTQNNLFAYDDQEVHPAINENAAFQSSINSQLIYNFGYSAGIETNFTIGTSEKKVWEWLSKGGKDEDNPFSALKFLDHFHDPLKTWDDAGLDIPLIPKFESSIYWAQTPRNATDFKNDYSWAWARHYFYQALTTGNEEDFAITFTMLGHLMHLISDMAVPAHVRNDSHPWSVPYPPTWKIDPYEIYTAEKVKDLIYSGTNVDISIFTNAFTPLKAPVPITALWDKNIYNGSNPSVTVKGDSNLTDIGLAEYTNANFFSKDSFHDYSYPDSGVNTWFEIDWGNPIDVTAEDGIIDRKIYLYGNAGGGSNIKLAGVSVLTRDTLERNAPPPWTLDEEVHKDYASRLVPAAVGYSTALLDYFFRGEISMYPGNQGNGYIISNDSDENMSGTFSLYYDDDNGVRHPVPGAEWSLSINARDISQPLWFDPPTSPSAAVPYEYMLVFQGIMGNETGAVVGKKVNVQAFIVLNITRDDGLVVTSLDQFAQIPNCWVVDSTGKTLSRSLAYSEETQRWLLNPSPHLTNFKPDPDGYFVYISINDSLPTQYPYKWKESQWANHEDLITPGEYHFQVPYWYVEYFDGYQEKDCSVSLRDWYSPLPLDETFVDLCGSSQAGNIYLSPGGYADKEAFVYSSIPYKLILRNFSTSISGKYGGLHYLECEPGSFYCCYVWSDGGVDIGEHAPRYEYQGAEMTLPFNSTVDTIISTPSITGNYHFIRLQDTSELEWTFDYGSHCGIQTFTRGYVAVYAAHWNYSLEVLTMEKE